MLKIDNNSISITRGDVASLDLKIPNYIFQVGDKIEFRVYQKKGLDKEYVLKKQVDITEETDTAVIQLTSEDTSLGEYENKIITYWYEIELNDSTTVIGYDDDGAKLFNLYPEGVE